MSFKISFSTRWADFDPNNHMRHSAYNDYAAESRVRLFNANGLSLTAFNKLNIGPILFREETNFWKEIALSDDIVVEVFLKGVSEKGERFKLHHKIFRGDGKLAAEINIYAAWMDLKIRKLCIPPQIVVDALEQLEKTDNFDIIPVKEK